MEELLHQHYALTRVSDYVATPAMPPNDDDTSKLISRTLGFLQLYREPGRLFKSAEWQGSWNNWIKTAETRLLNFETQHDGARNGLGKLEKELLWNLVLGDYNPIRPLTMVGLYSLSCVAPSFADLPLGLALAYATAAPRLRGQQ